MQKGDLHILYYYTVHTHTHTLIEVDLELLVSMVVG